MNDMEQARDAAERAASMARHPAGKSRARLIWDAYHAAVDAARAEAQPAPDPPPPPCNDCGQPATIQHRTGTSNGQAFYIWLCEPCHRECNQEWNRKGVHR